jgi:hypothetical protein
LDTPKDWEVRYNKVVGDGYIIDQMNDFRNLPDDTLESDIQSEFINLVGAIAVSAFVSVQNQKPKLLWVESWQDISMIFAARLILIFSTPVVLI